MQYDTTQGSAGTMCCGASFVWEYQAVPIIGLMMFEALIVSHADDAPVNCMGCIANDLG